MFLKNAVALVMLFLLVLSSCQYSDRHAKKEHTRDGRQAVVNPLKLPRTESPNFFVDRDGDTIITGVPIQLEGVSKYLTKRDLKKQTRTFKPKIEQTKLPLHRGSSFNPVSTRKLEIKEVSGLKITKNVRNVSPDTLVSEQQESPTLQIASSLAHDSDGQSSIGILNASNGLRDPYIYSISQDSAGNMWFGGEDSAIKYDGSYLYTFGEKTGLNVSQTPGLLNDSNNNLWLASAHNGIYKYDGINYRHFSKENNLGNLNVREIYEDNSGHLWFVAKTALLKYDGQHITKLEGFPSELTSIVEDSDGAMWISTYDDGIFILKNDKTLHIHQEDGLPSNQVNALLKDDNNAIWIALKNGVCVYQNYMLEHYTTDSGLAGNQVTSLIQDSDGDIWLGTRTNGANCIEDNSYITTINKKSGLSNPTVLTIYEDNQGNIWFGTLGGGANKLNKKSFSIFTTENSSFQSNQLRATLQDSKGRYWFGSNNAGLVMYDHGIKYTYDIDNGFIHNKISTFYEDQKNNIWIGSFRRGLMKYDGKNFTLYNKKNTFSGDIIMDIQCTDDGDVWVATWEDGLYRIKEDRIIHYNKESGLGSNTIVDILKTSSGLMFCAMDIGLIAYENDTFTNLTPNEGIPSTQNWQIAKKGDVLSVAGESKYFQIFNDSIYHFPALDSLDLSFQSANFSGDDLLLSTINEFLYLSFEDEHQTAMDYYIYDRNSGYTGGLIYKESLFTLGDSVCWGAQNGFFSIAKDDLPNHSQTPKVDISSIEINDKYIDFSTEKKEDHSLDFERPKAFENSPKTLSIPYNHNDISFNFTSKNSIESSKTRYVYKMSSINNQWSEPNPFPKAIYKNLKSGFHTLSYRSYDAYSRKWSDVAEFSFRIHPPWYATILAKIIYLLLLLLAVYLLSEFRNKQLKLKQRLLERKISEATAQLQQKNQLITRQNRTLEENLNQRGLVINRLINFASVLAHDIKEPARTLHSFGVLLNKETGTLDPNNDKTKKYLDFIVKGSKRLSQMIDVLYKYSNETLVYLDTFKKIDLRQVVKNIESDLMISIAENKATIDVDSMTIIDGQETLLHQLFQNLISNALKFTKPNVLPIIKIRTTDLGEKVRVSIEDNGIGISEKEISEIFQLFKKGTHNPDNGHGIGLATCKQIINIHNGQIWVESEVNQGSTFYVEFYKNISDAPKQN